jgi:hypothetical protein
MALCLWNGSAYEKMVTGITSINNSTAVQTTNTGVTSTAFTAPSLLYNATGVLFCNHSNPTSGNWLVELLESGVVKASGTVNFADMKPGFQYVRFTTPYTFATLAAGAYAVKVTNTVINNGNWAAANTGFWYEVTYSDTLTPAVGDDVWVGGFHNSGLTTKTLTFSGTSTSFGSGTDKAVTTTTNRTMGAGLTVFDGGEATFDTSADTTVQIRGSVFVTQGGHYNQVASASDIEQVSKLVFDCETANNNYGVICANGSHGGRVTFQGKQTTVSIQYASGVGTAANPIVTSSAHGLAVNDELIIPGLTYGGNQRRYVISIPSSTQLVVSSTLGGAESAITNTPTAGVWIGNLTRNCVVTALNTSRGYYMWISNTSPQQSKFSFVRWEYASCSSGFALNFNSSSLSATAACQPSHMEGMVGYQNSAAGRTSWYLYNSIPVTATDNILYETLGSNYNGQSGFALQTASNKIVNGLYHYAAPGSTANCAAFSLMVSSVNNTITDLHSYGAAANNGSAAYAIGIFASSGNTFNNCTVNNSRVRGVLLETGSKNRFNNCNFGTIGSNLADIKITSSTLNTAAFEDCSFGSATLLDNYLNGLSGTDIAFQNMDGNTSKHRWYTQDGSFWSSGSGLADTTVRTAGRLALAIKPEDATDGGVVPFKVPANPASTVLFYAYLYRNATFSSGDLIAELFLPGTLLTDTPDDTVTLATTTGVWLPFSLSAYNAGTDPRYATIRITAKTATAGAYAFLADPYDADRLSLWDEGHVAPVLAASDFSAIPELTRLAVWSDADTYNAGEKGGLIQTIKDEQTLPNLLIKDRLS